MTVTETFFAVEVRDMPRATAFYVAALGAIVMAATPGWSSLHIVGVRLGLALSPEHTASRVGLHFRITDLAAARDAIVRAGGHVVASPVEVAPGVVLADATDTEGNTFTLVASSK